LYISVIADGSDSAQRGVLVHVSAPDTGSAEQLSMTKTVVIAMSCVVAYLGVMAALTVYCLIHMVRSRRLRKHDQLHADEREYKRPTTHGRGPHTCLRPLRDWLSHTLSWPRTHLTASLATKQHQMHTAHVSCEHRLDAISLSTSSLFVHKVRNSQTGNAWNYNKTL